MKRIISRGRIPDKPDKYFIAECEKCKCQFEYDYDDIIVIVPPEKQHSDHRYCEYTDNHVVTCPHCGRKLIVPEYDNFSHKFKSSLHRTMYWGVAIVSFFTGALLVAAIGAKCA